MNLLYATTDSIKTVALFFLQKGNKDLGKEKHQAFGMRTLVFFQVHSSIRQQCICSRDMSCQLHPEIRAQQPKPKKGQHITECPSVKILAKGLQVSHVNCDFPKASNLD